MIVVLATLFACGVIVLLFLLDYDRKAKVSAAIWLPIIWLSLALSRSVSAWTAAFGATQTGGQSAGGVDAVQMLADGSPLDRNVLTALLAVGVLVLISRQSQVLKIVQASPWVTLFVLYCGLSLVWSDYPEVGFKRWIRTQGHVIMVLVVLTEKDRVAAMKQLLSRIGFLLIPLSILFIRYYPTLGRYYDIWVFRPSPSGVATNKNELGMLCLVCGLGAVWRLILEFQGPRLAGRLRRAVSQLALLAMTVWLFYTANSATSLACFLLGSGLIFARGLGPFAKSKKGAHILAGATLGLAFTALFLDSSGLLVSLVGRDATLTGRTEIWDVALALSGNPLTGVGFGSYWHGERLKKIWDIYWFHPVQAHSGYLEMYLNIGFIGLALLAMVILAGYQNLAKGFRQDMEFGRLKLAFFVVAIIYNATEAAFGGSIWFLLLLSIIAVPSNRPSAAAPKMEQIPLEVATDPMRRTVGI
ncbi:MAG: O-antigen ligase family protein [Bryobacteraceae bacterium]